MKKLCFILFVLFLPNMLYSDDIYQYSFKNEIELNSGELFIPTSKSKEIYFIKSGLMGEDAILHTVEPMNYTISGGRQIEGARIVKGHRNDDLIFLLLVSADSLYLNIFNNNNLIQNIYITISSESAFDDVSFGSDANGNVVLKIGKLLYLFVLDEHNELRKILLMSENCISYSIIKRAERTIFAYIEDTGEYCFLRLMDSDGIIYHSQIIPFSEKISLKHFDGSLALLFGSTTNSNTLINTLELQTNSLSNSFWLPAKPEFTTFGINSTIYYLTYDEGSYKLAADNSRLRNNGIIRISLPKELVEPIHFQLFDDFILLIFKNAIITYNYDLTIRSFDFFAFGKLFDAINSVKYIDNQLIITSNHFSLVLFEDSNEFWQIKSIISKFGQFIFPIILLFFILIIARKYRKEQRLVQTLLDMPASGFLYIIGQNGQLIEGNEFGRELLGLKKNIPMKRQFGYYFKQDFALPIFSFYEKIEKTNKLETEKVNIIVGGEQKEFLCNAVPINNIAGSNRGLILSGIDITEQLERKRLTNWAQLAHDMQTNLSTIRLNAEHLDTDGNESNKSRRKKIIHQVNILMNRIRDVITVGRSDSLDLSLVSSTDICNDVRMEFDEVVFPNVSFEFDIKEFTFKCDRQKLIRALRNAVENGIRALKSQEGKIVLACSISPRNVVFSVKDNGKGMDEDTQKKFLTPYFTTGEKSGGSGIGTMIMLRVAELHNGHLNIISELGKGTEIQFILPIMK